MNEQRIQLGSWPTPLEPAPRLSTAIGPDPGDLWIKRDDLTGLGGGGNKVRKLQYTCAAALAAGATDLITTGAAQSNHARLTAAAGARLGVTVHLVLAGSPPREPVGNLVLDGLFGANIVWAGPADDHELERQAAEVASALSQRGHHAAVIPFGGSSVHGARGYVECGEELQAQDSDLANVVVALGSGGTMAGLVYVLGARAVLGVHTGAVADPESTVRTLVQGLGSNPGPLWIDRTQVGSGYQALTESARAAMLLAARTEAVVLDPIYTARALAGLRAAVSAGQIKPGQRTVFVHTGGLPGLFGHPEIGRLTP
jgi:L-cysteate sulfo-lyase